MNKVMSYRIVKSTNIDWKMLGNILKNLQKETRLVKNKSIQVYKEWQDYCEEFKKEHNKYPKIKDTYGVANIDDVCYRKLKDLIVYMNIGNFISTITRATVKFKALYKDILCGNVSIPSFRNNLPIDIKNQNIKKLTCVDGQYNVILSLLSNKIKEKLDLSIGMINVILEANDNTQKVILDKCISGEYKICTSQIIYRKNKWILNLCYGFNVKQQETLDPNKIMGVDLGIAVPAYAAFNFDTSKRYHIKDDSVIRYKLRLSKDLSNAKAQKRYIGDGSTGHGLKCRMKLYKKYSNRAHNYQKTKNHIWSKAIVEWAYKNGCGTIQMEDLSGFTNSHSQDKFLGQWTYYELQQDIKYKAKEKGIRTIFIDPKYTSQRCSECGCIHKENRPQKPNQSKFKCIECGFEANADFNAARNISTLNIDNIIKKYLKEHKTDANIA